MSHSMGSNNAGSDSVGSDGLGSDSGGMDGLGSDSGGSIRSGGSIHDRKLQHIELAQLDGSQMSYSPFDRYDLPYTALPNVDLNDVDTSIVFNPRGINRKFVLSQPLMIASMTGGTDHASTINKNIAIAAQETGVAFGVGSQRIMLSSRSSHKSFTQVRKIAPDACIFGNIGAVQLNYGVKPDDVKYVLDTIKANGLYLHLNPLQEALQPEGDVNFDGLIEKIAELIDELDVPVFVKEVGHGIDVESAHQLVDAGVSGIDVAGAGGTSWAWIEAHRSGIGRFEKWFKDFGIPTDQSIQEIRKLKDESDFELIASGGVRSPVDGLKALLLGADLYSAARPFLDAALQGPDEVIDVVREWEEGLRIAMFSAGIGAIED